jgi:hypothetical protein
MPNSFALRSPSDATPPEILRLIAALAEYESSPTCWSATRRARRAALRRAPRGECLIAERDGRAVGLSRCSSPRSRPSSASRDLYLEESCSSSPSRAPGDRQGAAARLAALAVERCCGRFEWRVLDWNEPSIRFYESLGAKILPVVGAGAHDGAEFAALAKR